MMPQRAEADARAMSAVAGGDTRAFGVLIEAHQARIIAYCLRFLGDEGLAKDTAQEVFLTVWRERQSYKERGKLEFYLLRIARLRCLATAKKRRSQAGLAERYQRQTEHTLASDDGADARHFADAIARALATLKPKHADLIVLRHLEGLDLDEIREVTGLRIGTIKSRLSRGLAQMRKELSRD